MVRVLDEKTVSIPENVKVELNDKLIIIKGPLGELKKDFSTLPIQLSVNNGKVVVRAFWAGKFERALVGTVAAHIKNMIKGVTKGFTYKLKKVYSHFPINVKVEDGKVLIENFIGERYPRIAKVIGNVKVEVKGDDLEVKGINLEDVSQTAANIQQATKIKKKDPRVFLDGIYVYEKTEGV
ncbi:MAG: 50S ribosomal protein L6 [Candidatus Bathyarchaeota archaeon]|nr:50S ribosomal protein L6 [Candidatus Bathyarchaeota archaeon]